MFIDELHTLVGAGCAKGTLDAANILEPGSTPRRNPLHRRDHAVRYGSPSKRTRSLERRFQAIKVNPPKRRETIEVLMGVAKDRYKSSRRY